MYNLLLVDDEKLIRDGVSELLSMAFPELNITTAPSAVDAVAVFEKRKVDLAILDIQMPQMTGMDLYDILRERWPHCKLIFLTGYLEFDYVYKVHQHARYVLKAEDDNKIVEAVRDSLNELEHDLMVRTVSENILHSEQRRMYFERKLLLKELVEDTASWSFSRGIMENTGLDLDLDEAVYSVMLRCSAMEAMDYLRYTSVLESLLTVIENYYLNSFRGTYFGYGHSVIYLLLQGRKELGKEKTLDLLTGTTELVQSAVSKSLELPLSALIRDCSMPFEKAIRDFIAYSDNMLSMEEDEIRVSPINTGKGKGDIALSGAMKRELSLKVSQLENRFDNMDREGILSVLDELKNLLGGVENMSDLFAMEMYGSASAKLLSYVQRSGISKDKDITFSMHELYNLSGYSNWTEAFSALKRITRQIFSQVDSSIENRNEDVVNKIKHFIRHHLDGDTSLYTLSDYVHLCPEHLLRVFKKQEGVTVLQYINDMKLSRAKQLLSESDMQVKDIAVELGFTSAGYFGRFFKSKMGMTPNAYREQKQA